MFDLFTKYTLDFFFHIPATELQLNVIDYSSIARVCRKLKQDCVVFRVWDIG
jgi:hypothetical protein